MTSARSPRSPSSKTWNSPTGPAPTMTASVTVASLPRSGDKDVPQRQRRARRSRGGRGETLLLEPRAVEEPCLIVRPSVEEQPDNRVCGPQLARHPHRGGNIDAARAAVEEAF